MLAKIAKLHQLAGELSKQYEDARATKFPSFQMWKRDDHDPKIWCNSEICSTVLPCPFAFPRFLLVRAVADLGTKTSAMEDEYDKLIAVKTKGELQGFGKSLI